MWRWQIFRSHHLQRLRASSLWAPSLPVEWLLCLEVPELELELGLELEQKLGLELCLEFAAPRLSRDS